MAKGKKKEVASQAEAEKMIASGEAEVSAESVVRVENSDFQNHPKFAKFKKGEK